MADPVKPTGERKTLTPEAERALAEAAERRTVRDATPKRPREFPEPAGPDPARYGDWEHKGITSDF